MGGFATDAVASVCIAYRGTNRLCTSTPWLRFIPETGEHAIWVPVCRLPRHNTLFGPHSQVNASVAPAHSCRPLRRKPLRGMPAQRPTERAGYGCGAPRVAPASKVGGLPLSLPLAG